MLMRSAPCPLVGTTLWDIQKARWKTSLCCISQKARPIWPDLEPANGRMFGAKKLLQSGTLLEIRASDKNKPQNFSRSLARLKNFGQTCVR
jgi:hypothetical protein